MSNYVDKDEFLTLLTNYSNIVGEKPKIPEKIGKMFMQIANNFMNRLHCINYTQDRKDEIVSNMLFYMCKYINSYKVDTGTSPFAYFTQIARSQLLQYLNEQKKHKSRFINLSFIEHMDESEMVYYE